jgi:twitching motility protein PilT
MLAEKLKKYAEDYDLSDVHIRSSQPIAIRVNGEIMVFEDDIISKVELEEFWKSVLTKKQLIEIVNERDLDFATVVEPFRFRANGYYTSFGPSMVLRKIVSEIPDMEKLGLPNAVNDAIKYKSGLVLVTGQTGSGKSTSLAAMIDQINSSRS